jgi:hypothetical protein
MLKTTLIVTFLWLMGTSDCGAGDALGRVGGGGPMANPTPAVVGRRVADQEGVHTLDHLLLQMDISACAEAAAGVPLAKNNAAFLAAKHTRLQAMRDRLGGGAAERGGGGAGWPMSRGILNGAS